MDFLGGLGGASAGMDLIGMGFSASESSKNRHFQQMMSSTAYQRAVKDMENAGLNPMLAYQQGGASTPAGAMASAPSGMGSGVTSGVRADAEIDNMKSTNDLIKAQTAEAAARTAAQVADADLKSAQAAASRQSVGLMESQQREINFRIDTFNPAQIREIESRTGLNKQELKEMRPQQLKEIMARTGLLGEQAKHTSWLYGERGSAEIREMLASAGRQEMLADLDFWKLPEARAQGMAWQSEYGQKVRPYIDDIWKGSSAAGNILDRIPFMKRDKEIEEEAKEVIRDRDGRVVGENRYRTRSRNPR